MTRDTGCLHPSYLRRRLSVLAAGVGLAAVGGMLALSAIPAASQQKPIKIGFVSTFSGPTAAIGNDMRNSFELALDHLGRKIGGAAVEVAYEDDQQKPEVGKQKTDKLIEIRQGRFHRRLHLVERAARLARNRRSMPRAS